MATTIFMKDGTRHLIIDEKSHQEFASLLLDKLGEDAERHYLKLVGANRRDDIVTAEEELESELEDANYRADSLEDELKQARDEAEEKSRRIKDLVDDLAECLDDAVSGKLNIEKLRNATLLANDISCD